MLVLVYPQDGRSVRQTLKPGDTTIGRSPVCDLVINDPSISRRHARVRVHGDHCLLTDLGGRNGTFLNGELVAEAIVKSGDTITLGRFPLHLHRVSDIEAELSDHAPTLAAAATIYRRVDERVTAGDPWDPATDTARLLALVSAIADRLVPCSSIDDLPAAIARTVFDVSSADRAFLLLRDSRESPVTTRAAFTRAGRDADPRSISRLVVERAIGERLALLSTDVEPDAQMPTGPAQPPSRWFICVPLWHREETFGALYADSPDTMPLALADLDVLHGLAIYAGAAIQKLMSAER